MTDEAFEQAARTYADSIFRVAFHALRDRGEAEDVTQTVLMRLFQSREEFQSPEHLRHWIFRVAVNESRKILRSAWRRRVVPLEDRDGVVEGPEEDGCVLAAVLALDVKYRLPVYLYYYEELSIKEIAQALGSNPSTVQTRLQRAREKLRDVLRPEEEEGTPYVRFETISCGL